MLILKNPGFCPKSRVYESGPEKSGVNKSRACENNFENHGLHEGLPRGDTEGGGRDTERDAVSEHVNHHLKLKLLFRHCVEFAVPLLMH